MNYNKPLLYSYDCNLSLNEFLDSKLEEVSTLICNRIFKAIDNKLKSIVSFQIEYQKTGEILDFSVEEKDYYNTLETNKSNLIELERYEICSKINKYQLKCKK